MIVKAFATYITYLVLLIWWYYFLMYKCSMNINYKDGTEIPENKMKRLKIYITLCIAYSWIISIPYYYFKQGKEN